MGWSQEGRSPMGRSLQRAESRREASVGSGAALALTADRSFAACGGTSQLSTGWPGSTSSFGTMATPSSWRPREPVREAGGGPGTLASLQAWPAATAASRTGLGMPSGDGPARPPLRRASVSPSDSGPICAHRG